MEKGNTCREDNVHGKYQRPKLGKSDFRHESEKLVGI
jgi:hypothetical protein